MMDHRKIILVGCISAFVALTTAWLGITGTIIGSVLSSVLFNVLSEILEKPVKKVKFSKNKKFSPTFEYEIAYIFPLIVIAFIQLLLILSFLSEWGLLPDIFLDTYLLIQDLVDNNLYRIMGISLLVISIYPFILKPDIIRKSHGLMVGLVGLIFVARGFVDWDSPLTHWYIIFFKYFDFPIELVAFILIMMVILGILISAGKSQKQFKKNSPSLSHNIIDNNNKIINESSEDIRFESNKYFKK